MQNKETTNFRDFVLKYRNAESETRKTMINDFFTYNENMNVRKRTGFSRIEYMNDKMIYHHVYKPIRHYYMDTHSEQDLEHYFIIFFMETLDKVKLSSKDGKEYTNGQIIEYFKKHIIGKFKDLLKQEEGQFRNDLDIDDDEMTYDKLNWGNRKPRYGYINTSQSDDKNDDQSEMHVTDLYAVQKYNELHIDNPVKHFIGAHDIRAILDDKTYYLYEIYMQSQQDKELVPDGDSIRKIAKGIGKGKSTVQRWNEKLKSQLIKAFDQFMEQEGKYIFSNRLGQRVYAFINDKQEADLDSLYDFSRDNYHYTREEIVDWHQLQRNQWDYTYNLTDLYNEHFDKTLDDRRLFFKIWRSLKYGTIDWIGEDDKKMLQNQMNKSLLRYAQIYTRNETSQNNGTP